MFDHLETPVSFEYEAGIASQIKTLHEPFGICHVLPHGRLLERRKKISLLQSDTCGHADKGCFFDDGCTLDIMRMLDRGDHIEFRPRLNGAGRHHRSDRRLRPEDGLRIA
ncbi:hypothetical protein HNS03_01585 [Amorphus sp. 3PC139-8]